MAERWLRKLSRRRWCADRADRRLRLEPLEQRLVLDSTVVFNEIMYRPETDETSLEWVELYNQMSVDMDLSGWSVGGGHRFSIPAADSIAGARLLGVVDFSDGA